MRRAMLVSAMVALLALVPVVHGAHYERLEHTDTIPQFDLDVLDSTCPKALRGACDARVECAGFSTNGVLKSRTSPDGLVKAKEGDETTHLYIKAAPSTGPSNVWPAPQSWSSGASVISVIYPFTFNVAGGKPSADLSAALERFNSQIFPHRAIAAPASPALSKLSITVQNQDVPLQLGVDESYTLTIPDNGASATLQANTYYGALRGLETFSQLVQFNFTAHGYLVSNAPWSVTDFPRFQHRGVMIDTARHFEPVQTIKTVIDSLTYAKFNTLHWHVVDSQSFPFESRSYPNLWNGAYSPQERYTQEDMADVVEYARQRGIRVVIEFDIPGHAESWCKGYPSVCPSITCPTPLDPSVQDTYDLMTGLWGEVTGNASGKGIFPDNYIHLGGDEVSTGCWSNTPRIQAWMDQQGITADQAYMYIVKKAHDIVESMGRHSIHWEEVFLHFGTQLSKGTIIHIWLDHPTLAKVVAAGYQGILSNSDSWYLDHLGTPWQTFYANEPFQSITDPKQQALVLGGEVCMWGETVDSSDIFATIWPRAAAAAERLWSPADLTDTDAALLRLERFRCLLNTRGIGAAPTQSVNGRDAPYTPGSCYVQ